jgi:hypothetical protein
MIGAYDHLLVDHLGVGEDLRQAHHPVAGHTGRIQLLDPIIAGPALQALLDRGVDRAAVRDAQVVGVKARVLAQLGHPEGVDQPLIGLLLRGCQRYRAVFVRNRP